MSISPDSFELTPDQFARLANLAKSTGKSLPEVLDDALATYHPQPAVNGSGSGPSFYDLASQRGLVGCIQGTPPDLSSNRSYLEGFGESGGQNSPD